MKLGALASKIAGALISLYSFNVVRSHVHYRDGYILAVCHCGHSGMSILVLGRGQKMAS